MYTMLVMNVLCRIEMMCLLFHGQTFTTDNFKILYSSWPGGINLYIEKGRFTKIEKTEEGSTNKQVLIYSVGMSK